MLSTLSTSVSLPDRNQGIVADDVAAEMLVGESNDCQYTTYPLLQLKGRRGTPEISLPNPAPRVFTAERVLWGVGLGKLNFAGRAEHYACRAIGIITFCGRSGPGLGLPQTVYWLGGCCVRIPGLVSQLVYHLVWCNFS